MKVLKQKNTLEKFITNAEAYIKCHQISTMELFGLAVFAKSSIIDFRLGSKYTSVIKKIYESNFFEIPKIFQEITILEYSFSKVVGLKETCNFYFCITLKNN